MNILNRVDISLKDEDFKKFEKEIFTFDKDLKIYIKGSGVNPYCTET